MTRPPRRPLNRRRFLQSAATAAGAAALASPAGAAGAAEGGDLQVGLIGCGSQGQALLNICAKMSGVRIAAACDIWEDYNLSRASNMLTQYGHEHRTYAALDDLLQKEKDLDAVLIATPDFCHAKQTATCLEAGLPVYCESPMAATLEGARAMARTAKTTGKLLQIGHQRRSNPYYRSGYADLIHQTKLLGRITAANAQWNRPVQPRRGWPRRAALSDDALKKFGYESMDQFRNWRWCDGLSAGPLVNLGVHQIDVLNWFLDSPPQRAFASGGVEYYELKTHPVLDTVMAILEYPGQAGAIRAFYQSISSNSNSGYFESFMGDQGTLYVSEVSSRVKVFREPSAPDWDKWVRLGLLASPESEEKPSDEDALLDVQKSVAPPSYLLSEEFNDPPHQPHLANFFNAVRGQEELHCPAEVAFAATVVAFRINEAAQDAGKIEFQAEDFQA